MSKKNITIDEAINVLANFFYEPEMKRIDDGTEIEVNALSYIQRRMLNSLCYGAKQTLVNSKSSYQQAVDKVKLAARAHRGDEISDNILNRAVSWAERLELQIAMLEEFADAANTAHLEHTGEAFTAPVKQPTTQGKRLVTEALANAAKYIEASDEPEPAESGVDLADERAS
jgi:hypothetical protein